MNGKEELQARIKEKQNRIDELINKFVLTPEIAALNNEISDLRNFCGENYGHEYENGICRWCGHKEIIE